MDSADLLQFIVEPDVNPLLVLVEAAQLLQSLLQALLATQLHLLLPVVSSLLMVNVVLTDALVPDTLVVLAALVSAGYSFYLINSVVLALVTAVLGVNLLLVLVEAAQLLQATHLHLLLPVVLSQLMVNVVITDVPAWVMLVDLCHVVPLLDG